MKSNKRNYRRIKKRKTKRNKTNGGKVIGIGSDGVILHPSYLIESQRMDNNTVSKVFTGPNNRRGESDSANYEMDAEEMLDMGTKRNGIQIPSNYFVLPIEMFSMDKHELSEEDKSQLTGIFNQLPNPIWMITYPKGEMSADDYLTKYVNPTNLNSIKRFFIMYENVAYAVKRMQYNDIVHRDFKLGNVLFINDTFKIADITYLSRIEDIHPKSEYIGISRYYTFPSIYGFITFFIYPIASIEDKKLISYINTQLSDKSDDYRSNYSTGLFNNYISLFDYKTLEYDEATRLQSYHFNLEKDTTIKRLSELLHAKYSNNLRLFKTYLFLTIDTYSFGMSLMEVAVHYFIPNKTSNPNLLKNLHSIIFKCCNFSVEIKDFNKIYKMYEDMVKHL